MATIFEKLISNNEKKGRIYFSKKTFQKACWLKKKLLLLHPLTERLVRKQEEYVPRHIELTAVLREILKQI